MPLSLTSVPTFEQYQSDPTIRAKLNDYFRASGWQISGDVKFADQYQNAINTLKTNVDKANQQEVLSGGAQNSTFLGSTIDTAMKYGLVSGSITPDQNYYSDINQFTTQKAGGTGNYSWITSPKPFTPTKGANQYQLGDTITTGGTLNVTPPPSSSVPQGNFTSAPDATHTLKAYDTNNNYATVYVKPGEYVPGVSLYPKDNSTITPESLSQKNDVTISGGSTGTPTDTKIAVNSAVSGVNSYIQQMQDALKATQTTNQIQGDTLTKQISDLLGQESGKSAFTTQQNQALVDPLQAQLVSTQNQIQSLQAEQNQAHLDSQGKPMTLARLSGEEARIDAQYNSKILMLTASANSLMNNITLAKDQVQRAVDAKYGPIEEQISIKQAQLQAIQPLIDREQQVQYNALNAYYTQQQNNLNQLKTDIKDAMTAAIKAGITDTTVLDKISSATSGLEALKILGENMPTGANADTQVITANGQTMLIDKNTGRVIKNYSTGDFIPTIYIQGQDPTADAWVERINAGQAKLSDITGNSALKNLVIQGLQQKAGNFTTNGLTELQSSALSSAEELLKKFNDKKGTSAVGKSGFLSSFGYGLIPGTERADFVNKYNSLIAQLQLDNVKYLKGQGQVSDAERKILSDASTALKLSQSEADFGSTLQGIVDSLKKVGQKNIQSIGNTNIQNNQSSVNSSPQQIFEQFYLNNQGKRAEIDNLINQGKSDEEILQHFGINFNNDLSMSQKGSNSNSIAFNIPDGVKGGQCGHFVNQLTGLGVGDSYQSKIAKMNPAIKYPQPGMVFVMPTNGATSEYGHVGIILSINNGIATVKDSNWHGDERVLTHQIPISQMTGFNYS